MATLAFVLALGREKDRVGHSIFHVRSAECSLPCDYLVVVARERSLYFDVTAKM